MSIEYTYEFPAVEKNSLDDTFVTLHWVVTGVKGVFRSRLYGSVPAQIDPTVRNYNILTYNTLYSWFQTFGDIASITSKIEQDIYSQEFPSIETVQPFRFTTDSQENALYIQNISGNILTNAEVETGAIYHVDSIVVNNIITMSNQNSSVVYDITNIGSLTFDYNGNWEFNPVFEYEGNIPEIKFNLARDIDSVTDTCILTLTPINRPFSINKEFTSQGLLNTVISGSILPEPTLETTYSINSVIINGITTILSTNTDISIVDVGTFSIDINGDWSFEPLTDYTGSVPLITFVASRSSDTLKDTIKLNILQV